MIYVLQTSVKTKRDVLKLRPLLAQLCNNDKWNFALDDCDKVLRIDSQRDILQEVIALLHANGFSCREITW